MSVRVSSAAVHAIDPPMGEGGSVPSVGRPSLKKEQADRVVAAMRRLLTERYDNNKTRLAAALGRSQPSISDLLHPQGVKGRPSYETAERVAKLVGVSVAELMGGESAREHEGAAPRPNLDAALRQLGPLATTEATASVRRAAKHLPDLAVGTWIVLLMDDAHRHADEGVPPRSHQRRVASPGTESGGPDAGRDKKSE